ncbi:hypothetical protein JCM11641_000676 [Rhodosporidiobolus odoratus]
MTSLPSQSHEPFYPSGHHSSVLASHRTRTASNSAPHLLPHLHSTDTLLDVGCGPGSLTCSFAPHVAQVVGVEHPSAGEAVLEGARADAASQGLLQDIVTFLFADALALPFADNSFDVVYCHQVLQHVPDPIGVLKEMRRVSKRLVAAREADRGTFVAYPDEGFIRRCDELWYGVARAGGGEPDAGRRLKSWALEAGFAPEEVEASTGSTCPGPKVWSEMWAQRTVETGFAQKAIELGLSNEDELKSIAEGWKKWGQGKDAWFGYVQGDLLAWKKRD